jgi:hypothetical protein
MTTLPSPAVLQRVGAGRHVARLTCDESGFPAAPRPTVAIRSWFACTTDRVFTETIALFHRVLKN